MSDNLFRRSDRIINKRKTEKQNLKNETKLESNEELITKSNETKCQTIGRKGQKLICQKCCSHGLRNGCEKRCKSKPKLCFDSDLQKTLKVCNNCAKRMTRSEESNKKPTKESTEEQKRKYLLNCHSFALSLVQLLNDSSAERLYCPNLKSSGNACACLQRYVIGSDDNLPAKQERAQHLLDLLSSAKRFSQLKCYSVSNPKTRQKIGLGNGQKRSQEFADFVNNNRKYLRKELGFCERAAQRVLFYSNNFLHKKLKTERNGRRAEPQKGKSVSGKLIDINLLANQFCCAQQCTQLCETHPQLLADWRQRAAIGQLEARRVLAEMLTPTQAVRTNCFKFISLVTGISLRTIDRVLQNMRTNGGNREPKEHGLKRSWIKTDHKQTVNETIGLIANHSVSNALNDNLTENRETLRTIISINIYEQTIDSTNEDISGNYRSTPIDHFISNQINTTPNHSSNDFN